MSPLVTSDTLLGGISRVLFLHAHPDDETITTGSLIAALLVDGVEVAVVSATRGERGEVVAGALPAGLSEDQLSAARESELAAALAELGRVDHFFLGIPPARAAGLEPRHYHDSGMRWVRPGLAGPSPDSGEASLTAADPSEVTADIVAAITSYRPDMVITYDAGGGYGHPDHVLLHHAGCAAGRQTGVPVAEIIEACSKNDDPAVQWFDAQNQRATVIRALRRYASQLTVVDNEIVHVGGQREPITTRVGLRLRRLTA